MLMSRTACSPIGRAEAEAEAASECAARSDQYRATRDEYARIRELHETNPIAAHLRERRFELGLTQQQSRSPPARRTTAISGLESGTHTPHLATLQKTRRRAR